MKNNCVVFCLFIVFSQHIVAVDKQKSLTPILKHLRSIKGETIDSGLDFVDCIYVINLEERPGKWLSVKSQCDEIGLRINRFNAINGWKFSNSTKKDLSGKKITYLNGGQYGCILSHLSILKHAYDNNFSVIWVMEDDIKFRDCICQIPEFLMELSEIDMDWDIFYTDIPDRGNIERILIDDDFMQINRRHDAHSMIISHSGLSKILNHWVSIYVTLPFDIEMNRIPGLRRYAPRKNIVTRSISGSSDTTRPPP